MTTLITGDIHLNNLARDAYRHDFQKELRRLIKKYGVHTVLILGDLTDEKDFHPAQLVNKWVDHVDQLRRLVEVIFLMGNHDRTAMIHAPFFAFLRHLEGVHWVGTPMLGRSIIDLPAASATAVAGALFLPHSPNPKRDWEKLDLKTPDIIYAHNTFEGAIGDSGHIMSGAPIDIFPKDATVLSGDVHVPQKVGPVTYVGSPYRIDFGDSFEPRVMLRHEDGGLESVSVDGVRKQLIKIRADELMKLNTPRYLDPLAEGDIFKVRVELSAGDYAHWGEYREKVQAWADKHGFVINMIQPINPATGMSKKKAIRVSPKSDGELLKVFAKRQNVDSATLKIGEEFL
jgi:hypothetical protein